MFFMHLFQYLAVCFYMKFRICYVCQMLYVCQNLSIGTLTVISLKGLFFVLIHLECFINFDLVMSYSKYFIFDNA